MDLPLDKDKLARVLQLTTSPVDAEALAAMRTANAMLKNRNLLWTDVLQTSAQRARPQQQAKPRAQAQPDEDVSGMIEEVLESMPPGVDARSFIESLQDQFDRRGWLSPKQLEALRRFHSRATRST